MSDTAHCIRALAVLEGTAQIDLENSGMSSRHD